MNSLDEKKGKTLKCLSKIIYIFSMIVKVFMIFGAVCLFVCAIAFPAVMKNISLKGNELIAYGEKINFERNQEYITLKYRDEEYQIKEKEDVKDFNFVLDMLEKQDLSKLKIDIEILLIGGTIVLIILAFTFEYLKRLFVNFHDKDTPFIPDNVKNLRLLVIFLTSLYVIPLLINIIIEIVSKTTTYSLSFNSTNAIVILGLLSLSYIFEYGCMLQENSKKRIYLDKVVEEVKEETPVAEEREVKVVKKKATTNKKTTTKKTSAKKTTKETKSTKSKAK